MKHTLIALLDVETFERPNVTRLDEIKLSLEWLGLDEPTVGHRVRADGAKTAYAPVTWVLNSDSELKAVMKYMDETSAAYVVVGRML